MTIDLYTWSTPNGRKASIALEELELSTEDLEPWMTVEEVYLPPETEGAEIIEGDPSTVVEEIIRIMKEKGVTV